jgi:hypothetical protein
MLTLFTTPVIYLYMDRTRLFLERHRDRIFRRRPRLAPAPGHD